MVGNVFFVVNVVFGDFMFVFDVLKNVIDEISKGDSVVVFIFFELVFGDGVR